MHQDPSLLLPPFHFVTPRGLFCPNYVEGRLTREGSGEHAAPQYGGAVEGWTPVEMEAAAAGTDLGGVEKSRWRKRFVKNIAK